MLVWELKQKPYFNNGLVDIEHSTDNLLLLDMNMVNHLSSQERRKYRDYMFFVLDGCRVDTYNETIYYKMSGDQIVVGLYDLDNEVCVTAVILPDDCLDNNRVKKYYL